MIISFPSAPPPPPPPAMEYTGQIKDGQMHGQGKLTFPNGEVYEVRALQRQLLCRLRAPANRPARARRPQGDWVYGKRHGKGAYFFADGGRYEVRARARSAVAALGASCPGLRGSFSRAIFPRFGPCSRHGPVSLTGGRGAARAAQGEWVDDKICGHGRCVYANGNTYEGDWMDGRIEGKGTLEFARAALWMPAVALGASADRACACALRRYADGDKYTGDWKDGKMDGQGTYL